LVLKDALVDTVVTMVTDRLIHAVSCRAGAGCKNALVEFHPQPWLLHVLKTRLLVYRAELWCGYSSCWTDNVCM